MTACPTCLKFITQTRVHEDGTCPVRASFWCSHCCCRGHHSSECDEKQHIERLPYLEDHIPFDIKERFNITTRTLYVYDTPTLEVKEREIAETNTLTISYKAGSMDSAIREKMRGLRIQTAHKKEDNLRRLREWAVDHGKKVRLVQEV